MHILVVNDDGPPSHQSSPYVHSLVRELQSHGHTVSVCLPHTQRSWIGKAHMIGQTVKPLYYRSLGPVDLVVSGPNYGRNTTAVFALSSGTLGGALEAAACRTRAIALSFAFFSRYHDPVLVAGACRHAVRVVLALADRWPADGSVDLYSVNVPLVEDVESHKTLYTAMLQNYWRDGSCFTEVEGSVVWSEEEEERIREDGEVTGGGDDEKIGGDGAERRLTHRHFKWAPRFTDVYRSVDEAPPGNDGWAVKEGYTRLVFLFFFFLDAEREVRRKQETQTRTLR